MAVVNKSSSDVLLEIDFDENNHDIKSINYANNEWVQEDVVSYSIIDSINLIYRFSIKENEQLIIATDINIDPPRINHIESLNILEPYKKEYRDENSIRALFDKSEMWRYEFRIE